jgi:signal transduction histidine kinase
MKPTENRNQLQLLKRGMILLPLLVLILHVAYGLLVIRVQWQEVLPGAFLTLAGSLVLVWFALSIVSRLQTRSGKQQEYLAMLHQIDIELGSSLDQEQVLQAVLKGALHLTTAQAARAFAYDPQRRAFTQGWEHLASGACYAIDHLPRPDGFNAHVVQAGDILIVEDAAGAGSLIAPEDVKRGFRSAVGIPLLRSDQVLGVLSIGFEAPHTFTAGELETLSLLGNRAAMTLDNARLFKEAVREREVAHTLLETAETLSTTLRLDRLLERILNGLQEVIPYDAASINLVHEETCWPVASRGRLYTPSTRFLLEEFPLVRRVVRERGPIIIPDTRDKSNVLPRQTPGPVQTWMGMPLISKDEVIGVLMVESHQPSAYDEEMARLALVFARQAALAIENSRLYEQTRAQLREATLLHSVMVALSSTLDVDQILPYVARSLCEVLNVASVEIYSLDEEARTVSVIADYADTETAELSKPLESARTYALADLPAMAEALAHRRPVQMQVDSPDMDTRDLTRLETRGAQAALLLPMIARDRVLGFAQVWESQSPRRFTEGKIAVAQTLIHPAAIAMENARLFGEIEDAGLELQARARALEEANVRLKEMDQLKRQFLARVSHELRTPLNSIIGFSEVLLEGSVGEISLEMAECVEIILTNGEHLLTLINDILDLSRIEAGRMNLYLTTFSATELLEEVTETIRPMIEKRSQVLTVNQADDSPLLTADRLRVKQVLLNLLSNANKFTPEGGQITLSCQLPNSKEIYFSVADNGIGISEEDQMILFEEFRQVDGSLSRKASGAGLGLAISKRLVEMHGGRIWVKSDVEQGATFSFKLPLHGPPQPSFD